MNNLLKIALWAGWTIAAGAPLMAQDAVQEAPRQITVVGTGSVSTTPDIMRITLVVMADAPEATDAIRQMSSEMESVMSVLSDAGVPARDIQTTGLRLTQRYTAKRDDTMQPELAGFTASSDVTVVVRDIDQSGGILDAVVEAGANHINGLEFDVSERTPLLDQARGAAVADAIAKTALYAQAAALTPGAILSIEESGAAGGFPRDISAYRGLEARDIPIAAGAFEVSAQVTLTTAVQ